MISSNFGVAVVTVVLRGLVERILATFQTPVLKTSLVSQSAGAVLFSGTLYVIYNYLISGKKIQVSYSPPSNRRAKILDGRLHKNESQSSSVCDLRERRPRLRKFRTRGSRSRCRDNLLQAAKDSLHILHGQCSSAYSISSKSASSLKCSCIKDPSTERAIITKESSPSFHSIKTEGDNLKEEDQNLGNCKGYGDCDWEEDRPKLIRRRKRVRTTRKTRSGKIYSSYL